jgi:hypothetical protein
MTDVGLVTCDTCRFDKQAKRDLECDSCAQCSNWMSQRISFEEGETLTFHEEGVAVPTIDNTLKERGSRYGTLEQNGLVGQGMKRFARLGVNWDILTDGQKESIEMICHKISRIVNGDPNYKDSWHDIIGYAKLIEDKLED